MVDQLRIRMPYAWGSYVITIVLSTTLSITSPRKGQLRPTKLSSNINNFGVTKYKAKPFRSPRGVRLVRQSSEREPRFYIERNITSVKCQTRIITCVLAASIYSRSSVHKAGIGDSCGQEYCYTIPAHIERVY